MYASFIMYPVSQVPLRNTNAMGWCEPNPLVPIIEGFRLAFSGSGNRGSITWLASGFGIMLVVLAVGLMLFTHVEKTFMDTV